MIRVLAIDYGQKRIGVALSDPLGFTAQSLKTLLFVSEKKFIEDLKAICLEHQVTEVVIGLPINMDSSHGPKANEVMRLLPKMKESLTVPVLTWDERLTSKEAGRLMIQEGLSREKQKSKSDELAAILILQNYLEYKRFQKKEF